jgi:hypothetical protein
VDSNNERHVGRPDLQIARSSPRRESAELTVLGNSVGRVPAAITTAALRLLVGVRRCPLLAGHLSWRR